MLVVVSTRLQEDALYLFLLSYLDDVFSVLGCPSWFQGGFFFTLIQQHETFYGAAPSVQQTLKRGRSRLH